MHAAITINSYYKHYYAYLLCNKDLIIHNLVVYGLCLINEPWKKSETKLFFQLWSVIDLEAADQ